MHARGPISTSTTNIRALGSQFPQRRHVPGSRPQGGGPSSASRSGRRRALWTVMQSASGVASDEVAPVPRVSVDTLQVAVYSSKPYMRTNINKLFNEEFEGRTHVYDVGLNARTALMAKDCEAVNIFVNDECGRDTLEVLADLGVKIVSLRCAGFNNVDVDAAAELGIKVVRVPTYSPESIAEHAVTLMLCLSRRVHETFLRTRLDNYSLSGLVGTEIHGKTVGVVGTGNIGLAAARIFKGFGTRVLAYDPYGKPETAAEIGFEYVGLEELLAESDVVSLHCPLLPSTEHLIDAETIALMRPGVMLINTSRGGLVDTDALLVGLKSGQIGAYGMDVYENEKEIFFQDFSQESAQERVLHYDAKFHELVNLPNVLVTPHQAFLTDEALLNIAETSVANLKEFCEGKEKLTNEVLPVHPPTSTIRH